MTDKKVKELANEILQEFTNCYSEADKDCLVKIIRKYISKDTVLVNLDQYCKWQDEMCEMKKEIVRLNQTITPAKIRKETARECRNFIKRWVGNSDDESLGLLFDFEDFIAKQYGVKLEV